MNTQVYERFSIAENFSGWRNSCATDRVTVLAAAAIAHASVVFLLWLDVFYAESGLVTEQWWLMLVCLWVVWPLALVIHPAATLKRVSAAMVIGVALLAPCIPTALAFAAWEIVGFTL